MFIQADETDDPEFIDLISSIVKSVVDERVPEEVRVIRIDNWFDHKWLGFGGKVLGAIAVHPSELTVPPFNPGRVITESAFTPNEDAGYYAVPISQPLHIETRSEKNLRRKLPDMLPNAVVVWFSGNSRANQRGSLMVYSTHANSAQAWYASFLGDGSWRIDKQKGVSREEVLRLVTPA
ncbi:hypothetical protein OAU50_04340 [Planctomycetota bacterium]|nr:hypothetical protein [Planctomycetota bacterium]